MSKARQLADLGNVYDDGALSNRNLIINGAMQVAQRGTQTDQTGHFTACDRFQFVENGSVEVTTSQDTDVPSGQGFANSLKIDVTSASGAVSAGNYALVRTLFEGQDLQQLLYGTSSAKKLTLSFWVKSPKAGTHIVELIHSDAQYFNCISYTVNTADTWEHKSVIFDGYQTTNFDNDNARSADLRWWLMAGSDYSGGTLTDNTWHNVTANQAVGQVNVTDSISNNFYLTGVQLEVGDTATPFEHRSYGDEILKCYRYYFRHLRGNVSGSTGSDAYLSVASRASSSSVMQIPYQWPVPMRTKPSLSKSGNVIVANNGTASTGTSAVADSFGLIGGDIQSSGHSSLSANQCVRAYLSAGGSWVEFDAEL